MASEKGLPVRVIDRPVPGLDPFSQPPDRIDPAECRFERLADSPFLQRAGIPSTSIRQSEEGGVLSLGW